MFAVDVSTVQIIGGLIVTLVVGLAGSQAVAAWMQRRKTAAEARATDATAAVTLATSEGQRIDRALGVQEAVLIEVRKELDRQRALREQDRKDFAGEVATWRERSAKCDETLAAEIRAREHEKILARERDIAITDLQKELTLATSDVARLAKRADEEDRHARQGGTAAIDMLRQVGVQMAAVKEGVDAVQDEVKTVNGTTMAMYADQAEVRRVLEIPPAERTPKEAEMIADVTEEGEAK